MNSIYRTTRRKFKDYRYQMFLELKRLMRTTNKIK